MATRKKKASASKKNEKMVTRVALVIDRSGSMCSVYKEALSGINEQISGLRENSDIAGETFVTLIDFASNVKVHFNQKEASKLVNLEPEDYRCVGGTSLHDAVGVAIERLSEEKETCENTAYLVVVISDGEENSSQRYNSFTLSQKIKALQATGKWTFTYMLSNVDLSVAKNLGVPTYNVSSWTSTGAGTIHAYNVVNTATSNYLSTRGSKGVTATNSFYTPTTTTDTTDDSVKLTTTTGPLKK